LSIIETLNRRQQDLVDRNLDIVKWAIRKHITINESVFGMGYDDIFQEGCLCLCKAAATYDGERSNFITYAQVVVRNGLMSHCKRMCNIQKRNINFCDAPIDTDDSDSGILIESLQDSFDMDSIVADNDVLRLLESLKPEYTGVARLGIEALELKVKGYSGAEIAKMYGVQQNHVGAWISRAAQKLRKNEVFLYKLGWNAKCAMLVEKSCAETV